MSRLTLGCLRWVVENAAGDGARQALLGGASGVSTSAEVSSTPRTRPLPKQKAGVYLSRGLFSSEVQEEWVLSFIRYHLFQAGNFPIQHGRPQKDTIVFAWRI